MKSRNKKLESVDWCVVGARLGWVIVATAIAYCAAMCALVFMPADSTPTDFSTRTGTIATLSALLLYLLRMVGAFMQWKDRRLLWALDGFEGASVMLAAVAFTVGLPLF